MTSSFNTAYSLYDSQPGGLYSSATDSSGFTGGPSGLGSMSQNAPQQGTTAQNSPAASRSSSVVNGSNVWPSTSRSVSVSDQLGVSTGGALSSAASLNSQAYGAMQPGYNPLQAFQGGGFQSYPAAPTYPSYGAYTSAYPGVGGFYGMSTPSTLPDQSLGSFRAGSGSEKLLSTAGSMPDSANADLASQQQQGALMFGAPVPPAEKTTMWHYIDLSGVEQGPFSADLMSGWVPYFSDEVKMRRDVDRDFVPFGTLKELTGNPVPFAAKFTSDAWEFIFQKASETADGQSNHAAGTAKTKERTPVSPIGSPSPSMRAAAASKSLDLAPPSAQVSMAPGADILDKVSQLSVGDNKTSDDSGADKSSGSASASKVQQEPEAVPRQTEYVSISDIPESGVYSKDERGDSANVSAPIGSPSDEHTVSSPQVPLREPWKKPVLPTANVSIAELKLQRELEKQKKKKQQAETSHSSQRKATWTQLDPASLASSSAPSTPATPTSATQPPTPTWGKAPVLPAKSIAEVQKEQALKNTQAKVAQQLNSPMSIKSQQQQLQGSASLSPQLSLPSVSQATQNTKQQPSGPQHKSTSQSINTGRFHALENSENTQKAARANVPVQTKTRPSRAPAASSVTSAANSARPTDELIHWAKVSFKDLAKGVDAMELLDVFLSLPSNSSAKEFIAESIYSYSRTLDGRRFAYDFLSRKQQAEQSMKPGETWKDVLERFNPSTVEQDPSFKVVTKKRTRPVNRPESMRA